MKNIYKLSLYSIAFFTLFSCSKEEDIENTTISFYENAYKELSKDDLLGTWSIYSVTFNNKH